MTVSPRTLAPLQFKAATPESRLRCAETFVVSTLVTIDRDVLASPANTRVRTLGSTVNRPRPLADDPLEKLIPASILQKYSAALPLSRLGIFQPDPAPDAALSLPLHRSSRTPSMKTIGCAIAFLRDSTLAIFRNISWYPSSLSSPSKMTLSSALSHENETT